MGLNVPDPNAPGTSSSSSTFPPTRWTLVVAAGSGSGESARRALQDLLNIYEYILYSYLRRWGLPPDEARDEMHDFYLHLIEHSVVSVAEPARGRFRDFLLASLQNHVANRRKRESAKKRGGGALHVSIPVRWEEHEGRFGAEPSSALTPERLFEQSWAREVVRTVVREVREEYVTRGRTRLFDALITRLSGGSDEIKYVALAGNLGMQENAVRTAMFRLRAQLATAFRCFVADTVNNAKDLDGEIGYLLHILEAPSPTP